MTKSRALGLYYRWVESDDGKDAFDVVSGGSDEYEQAESVWNYFLDWCESVNVHVGEMEQHQDVVWEAIIGSLT